MLQKKKYCHRNTNSNKMPWSHFWWTWKRAPKSFNISSWRPIYHIWLMVRFEAEFDFEKLWIWKINTLPHPVSKIEKAYTILIPADSAFQRWHPIDWGFYPFSVSEFTENVLRNHFLQLKAPIRMQDIKKATEISKVKTMGGETVTFRNSRKISIWTKFQVEQMLKRYFVIWLQPHHPLTMWL